MLSQLANSLKILGLHAIQDCWSVPDSMLKLFLYLFFPVVLHQQDCHYYLDIKILTFL